MMLASFQAPEFFYNYLSEKMHLDTMEILRLSAALTALWPWDISHAPSYLCLAWGRWYELLITAIQTRIYSESAVSPQNLATTGILALLKLIDWLIDPRDQPSDSCNWSQWKRREWWSKYWVKIIYGFSQIFPGQQYWEWMKGTQQWNTAIKWRWLCRNADQLILNTLKIGEMSAYLTRLNCCNKDS